MSSIDQAQCLNFEQFVFQYPLFPSTVWSTFHIVRDIIIKQDVTNISLCDGTSDGLNGYLIHCVTASSTKRRVMIPWSADSEVELLWLDKFLKEQKSNGTEVYICIFTPESIIYELVETELC